MTRMNFPLSGQRSHSRANPIWTPSFVLLVSLLVLGFLVAGGSRDDILSLLIWRPLSAMALALALAWCWKGAWQAGRPLVVFAAAITGMVLLHLVPLPPAIWTALPGRQFIVDLYADVDIALPWLPLSVAQVRTWNALFSLAAPVAALLIALTLRTDQQRVLLQAILVLALLSGLLGLLQAIGPVTGPLYFYRVTNFGDGVGLFSNRNHQALLMASLFPLLTAYLSLWSGRPDRLVFQRVIVGATAAFLVPLLLVSGSRSGLILGVIGLGLSVWVYQAPVVKGRRVDASSPQRFLQMGIVASVGLGLILLTILAARASAIQRLIGSDSASEIRIQAFPTFMEATGLYFPLGSGIGTFVETYKIFEPDELLSPQYLNHAHNDYLEVVMTAGLAGAFAILVALAMLALGMFKLATNRKGEGSDRSALILARAGLAVLVLLALGSVTDYPLRVPSLSILGAICAAWAMQGYRSRQAATARIQYPVRESTLK